LARAETQRLNMEIAIAWPGGGGYRIYLPLVVRNKDIRCDALIAS